MWLAVTLLLALEYLASAIQPSPRWDAVSFLGYFKVSITAVKYMPQAYWNYSRKSTAGWSIFNILMDFTGGFFSFLQLILSRFAGDPNPVNLVKVLLGLLAMGFDILFMLQHYVFYRHSPTDPERHQLTRS
jgi:cystinosin